VTRRLVLLGASNARRGFPTFVRTSRAGGGTAFEIFGAFGHGRSYGKRSCIPFRCLPGILEVRHLGGARPRSREESMAVITDVGNDLLYGEDPDTILGCVAECVRRLTAVRITITGLPLAGLVRSAEADTCCSARSSSHPRAKGTAGSFRGQKRWTPACGPGVSHRRLFVEPDPDWYGADPIHVRRAFRETAWARILDTAGASRRVRVASRSGCSSRRPKDAGSVGSSGGARSRRSSGGRNPSLPH
jgi:hypothetical protein